MLFARPAQTQLIVLAVLLDISSIILIATITVPPSAFYITRTMAAVSSANPNVRHALLPHFSAPHVHRLLFTSIQLISPAHLTVQLHIISTQLNAPFANLPAAPATLFTTLA